MRKVVRVDAVTLALVTKLTETRRIVATLCVLLATMLGENTGMTPKQRDALIDHLREFSNEQADESDEVDRLVSSLHVEQPGNN